MTGGEALAKRETHCPPDCSRHQAVMLSAVLDRLGVDRVILVGHSWGGLLALTLRNLALDARVRSEVITAVDALTLGPDKIRTEAGIYLGLRSIFWSLVRAKSDDDLREVAARLWSMAVGLEDGDISEAQAALRAAQEALRNALDRGAGDQELKQLMDQLRAAMDRFMQAMQEQLKNNQQLFRPLDRNSRMLRQQDLKNMLDRLESMARSGAKDAARKCCSSSSR